VSKQVSQARVGALTNGTAVVYSFYSASKHSDSVPLSVKPSVCHTLQGIVSKRLKLRSRGLHWKIAPWS